MAYSGLTRGRRLLVAVLQITTETDIAARCGVYQQRVSDWASGMYTPSPSARRMLERNYRIPYSAWDIPFVTGCGDVVHRTQYR